MLNDIEFNFPEPVENESLEEYINKCKKHLIDFPYFIIPYKKRFCYHPITWKDEDFEYYLEERWKKYNTSFREKHLKSIKTSISNLRPQEFEELKQFIMNYEFK